MRRTASILVAVLVTTFPLAARAAGGTVKGTVTATPDKYLKDTVVYLVKVPGSYAPKTVVMDQKNLSFVPHVLAITVGDTVKFENHDHVQHNVFSPEGDYNLGLFGFGQSKTHTFEKAGTFTQLCSVHPDMLAYVFVGQNPYSAVPDDQGRYELQGVPPGTYELAVWNSELKAPKQSVTVKDGGTATADVSLAR